MKMHFRDGEWVHDGCLCQFGIISGGLIALGVGELAATVGADALVGAGIGGIAGELTTGKPLLGALTGGLTGGAIGGLGGIAGDALGSATAGDALVGAGAGALGAGITGQNPLTGAVEGGVGGAISANLPGGATAGSPAPSGGLVGGAGASAAGIAAPAGIGDALGAGSGVLDAATAGAVPAGIPLGQISPGAAADVASGTGGGFGGGTLSLASGATDVSGGGPVGGSSPASGTPSPVGDATSGVTAGLGNSPENSLNALYDVQGNAVVPPIPPGQEGSFSGIKGALGGAGDFLGRNANWLLPAATIGYDALKSSQGLGNIPGYSQLNAQAGQLGAQSQQLTSYLATGTLPPGVQTSLDQAGKAAMATIKSQYASRGMSGSSAEAQDLANVHNTIVSQGASIATQLLQTGISEAGLSSQLYSQILNANLTSDNQLGQALGTLAGAAARPTIQVNQPQSTTTG